LPGPHAITLTITSQLALIIGRSLEPPSPPRTPDQYLIPTLLGSQASGIG
jgi:hypothetical protein